MIVKREEKASKVKFFNSPHQIVVLEEDVLAAAAVNLGPSSSLVFQQTSGAFERQHAVIRLAIIQILCDK